MASLAPDGLGGLWGLGIDLSAGIQQLWHFTGGPWSADSGPPRVLTELIAVPHTTSTWAIGGVEIRNQ